MFLSCGCDRHSAAVVQGVVHLAAHPQVMQQHGELSGRGNDGPLLPTFSAALGQLQPPAPQVTIRPERAQNVLCPLHQQRPQIGIAFLADVHLRLALPGVSSPWLPGCSANLLHCRSPLSLVLQSTSITWERTASRRRPAFSSHLIASFCVGCTINAVEEYRSRTPLRKNARCHHGCHARRP